MKSKIFIAGFLFFCFSHAYSQHQFQKLVGIGLPGVAASFCISQEGNYVVACAGSLFQLDSNGGVVWVKNYLPPVMYNKSFVIRQNNGGYLMLVDIRKSGIGLNDMMVFNTDSAGQIDWIKIYGNTGLDVPADVVEMDNGDFIICGQSNGFDLGDNDMVMMRINKYGNQFWQRFYGTSSENDHPEKLIKTTSGGLIMAGKLSDQLCMVKTKGNGEYTWSKTYGYGSLYDMIENPANGDLFVCGKMVPDNSKSGENMLVMNTDSAGNVKWAKLIGNNALESANSLSVNSDFSLLYIAGQQSNDSSANSNAIALCLQADDGSMVWSKSYGSSSCNEMFYDNRLLHDNTLVNVGFSDYSDTTFHNLYIVKSTEEGFSGCDETLFQPLVDSNLSLTAINLPVTLDSGELMVLSKCYPPDWTAFAQLTLCYNSVEELDEANAPVLYPNPVSSTSRMDFAMGVYVSAEIFSIAGKCVKSIPIDEQATGIILQREAFAKGVYLLKLMGEDGSYAAVTFVVE
jgi:hypothetical protein